MRQTALVIGLVLFTACGGVSVTLPDEIGADFDLDQVLGDLRDCDALSDTFVAVVREGAADLDELAEATDGRVPAGELAAKVDVIADTAYFEVAERLGCDAVAQRLDTIDRLRDLSPSSEAGSDLVDEIIEELEAQTG